MTIHDEIIFTEMKGQGGDLGIISLNRPGVLNALNQTMIQSLHAKLKAWAKADHIKAVVIQAVEGRAFCAGGDIRLTYERCKAQNPLMTHFFRDEYELNCFIYHFPKPYIALLDGITMGGGVGISVHGSHRVATERLMFAMPETGIGFFPDVGGSYFLPRLPHKSGIYLGLTGARITGDDCVALGIAQHKVPHASLAELTNALAQKSFGHDSRDSVSHIINQFQVSPHSSSIVQHQDAIEYCFSPHNMEDIMHALQTHSSAFCNEVAGVLLKKSPTSLKVTLRALLEGRALEFNMCMQQEFNLTSHFLMGHDFPEGIRAAIIDKDQSPQWKPDTLAAVSNDDVDRYFKPAT
jgi:enoyl-CoA hydratase/carnithine racemase